MTDEHDPYAAGALHETWEAMEVHGGQVDSQRYMLGGLIRGPTQVHVAKARRAAGTRRIVAAS